jgi:cytochrome b6-f complex iron-sulfur subunit
MSGRIQLRRKILRWIGSIPFAFFSQFKSSEAAEIRAISLDRLEKLKITGRSVLLKVEGLPVLFVRESEETIRGVDPTCTHRRCTVEYNQKRKIFICPCHGSQYDLEGRVLKGPAQKPLKNLDAYLESGRIIFTLGEPDG